MKEGHDADAIDAAVMFGGQAPIAVEDCFRNLVAAVILQALRDLREPGYRTRAQRWLRTPTARGYAEQLGIEPDAVTRLAQRRLR